MDRLSLHHSKTTKKEMRRLNFKFILNAVNCPNYNPIEGVIGLAKEKVKRERLKALVIGNNLNLEVLIE